MSTSPRERVLTALLSRSSVLVPGVRAPPLPALGRPLCSAARAGAPRGAGGQGGRRVGTRSGTLRPSGAGVSLLYFTVQYDDEGNNHVHRSSLV